MTYNHPQFDQHRYTVHDLAKHVIIDEFHAMGWLNVHVNPDTLRTRPNRHQWQEWP